MLLYCALSFTHSSHRVSRAALENTSLLYWLRGKTALFQIPALIVLCDSG